MVQAYPTSRFQVLGTSPPAAVVSSLSSPTQKPTQTPTPRANTKPWLSPDTRLHPAQYQADLDPTRIALLLATTPTTARTKTPSRAQDTHQKLEATTTTKKQPDNKDAVVVSTPNNEIKIASQPIELETKQLPLMVGTPLWTTTSNDEPQQGGKSVVVQPFLTDDDAPDLIKVDSSCDQTTTTEAAEDHTISSPPIKLLVLCSQQSLNRQVVATQERAFAILNSRGIRYETLDGADPNNYDRRNELFGISGLRAKYPQFFMIEDNNNNNNNNNGKSTTTFWGDWSHFEMANETGHLSHVFGGAVGKVVVSPVSKTEGPRESPLSKVRGIITEQDAAVAASAAAAAALQLPRERQVETDITIYGATSFVARHVINYLNQVSLNLPRHLKVTLAGRNPSSIKSLTDKATELMSNLQIVSDNHGGRGCIFDSLIAESTDLDALKGMAQRTRVVLSCAGPFAKYSTGVVSACAESGTDYVDITGEISWSGQMRERFGQVSEKSGSRIVSFCGFDSIPSDLAVFAAVEMLREASKGKLVEVGRATTWFSIVSGAFNGGTVHTVVDTPFNFSTLMQPVPFLFDDPLVLTPPSVRKDPRFRDVRNRLAKHEWLNLLPNLEPSIGFGVSAPFLMAPINAKIVHASAIALKYGNSFVYHERYLPTGFAMTKRLGLVSLVPALITQAAMLVGCLVLRLPFVGPKLANWLTPPGSGPTDQQCRDGSAVVYAEVQSVPDNQSGGVREASCFVKLQGDPGNWVTAQLVCESAICLVFNRNDLPERSVDGFGTPAELLGQTLLTRLQATPVRPVVVDTQIGKKPDIMWQR